METSSARMRGAMEPQLPLQWTPVDQDIIEDLLFVEPPHLTCSSELAHSYHPYSSSATVSATIEHTPHASHGGAAAVHPHAHIITPEPCSASGQHLRMQAQHMQPDTSYTNADEMRKAKHREVQRRFMIRKKEQIKRTKQLAKELEIRHDVLQLTSEAQKLASANAVLQEQLKTHGPDAPSLSKAQVELILEDQLKVVRAHYEPLSDVEWSELLRKNLDDFDALAREQDFESTGVTVMGWSDRRKQETSTLKFVLSKTFAHLDAADFMNTTWAKLWLPKTHSRLFSPAVTIKIQILQTINDDTVVMHRAFFNPQTHTVVHSIETMTRLQHGRDFIVFLRSPDRCAVSPDVARRFDWVQIWTSLVFTPLSLASSKTSRGRSDGKSSNKGAHVVEGCVLQYGGAMRDFSPADTQYWLMEMLYVLLRFETVMVAPVFALLPPQADSHHDRSSSG